MVYESIAHRSPNIFFLANQIRKENVDVIGDKPVKPALKNDASTRRQSRRCGLNIMKDFSMSSVSVSQWDPDHLSNELPSQR